MFGGGDKADLLNDLHVFDVRTTMWSTPPTAGLPPPPRSRHVSAVINHQLFIWGGIGGGTDLHALDASDMSWSTPKVLGDVPDSRFGHSAVVVEAGGEHRLYILGGHNSREALSDVRVLELSSMTWV